MDWTCLNILAVLVVQFLSHIWLFVTPWTAAHQASLSFTITQSLLKLISIESVTSSNHLVLCHPLLHLSSIFPNAGSFPICFLFTSNGQTSGASASTTVLPLNIQGWVPLGLTRLTSLQSQELSRIFSSTTQFEGINCLALGLPFWTNSHICTWLLEKPSFAYILFIRFYQPFIPLREVPKLRV